MANQRHMGRTKAAPKLNLRGRMPDPPAPPSTDPAAVRIARAVLLYALMDYTRPLPNPARKTYREALTTTTKLRLDAQEFLFGTDTRAAAYWCAIADVPLAHIRNQAHDVSYDVLAGAYHALVTPRTTNTTGFDQEELAA